MGGVILVKHETCSGRTRVSSTGQLGKLRGKTYGMGHANKNSKLCHDVFANINLTFNCLKSRCFPVGATTPTLRLDRVFPEIRIRLFLSTPKIQNSQPPHIHHLFVRTFNFLLQEKEIVPQLPPDE